MGSGMLIRHARDPEKWEPVFGTDHAPKTMRDGLMPDRQQVEQGRCQSEAGKADEDDRDHRVADKGDVSPQRRHNILGFHHGLTLVKESSLQGITVVCPRNHPAYKSYIKF
jgi:hypothetical protein